MVRAVCRLWLVVTLAAQTRKITERALQTVPERLAGLDTEALVRRRRTMSKYCLRCSTCGINWPQRVDCRKCLSCGGDCWPKQAKPGEAVVGSEEVDSMKRRADFEKYCEDRDREQMVQEADALAKGGFIYVDSILGVGEP